MDDCSPEPGVSAVEDAAVLSLGGALRDLDLRAGDSRPCTTKRPCLGEVEDEAHPSLLLLGPPFV